MSAPWITPIVDWLATYAIHSTVLLSMVWLCDRYLKDRPALAVSAWKTALVGGVVTASLQVGGWVTPMGGVLAYTPTPEVSQAKLDPGELPVVDHVGSHVGSQVAYTFDLPESPGDHASQTIAKPATELAVTGGTSGGDPVPWRALGFGLWCFGAVIGTARIAGAWWGLGRQLRGRRTIQKGRLRWMLDNLRAVASVSKDVELSCTHRIDVPLALGVPKSEICVPRRVIRGLDRDEQECLLAHELAHVVRRDPLWRIVGATIEGVLFFQPLNRVANRRLAIYSEYLCDEWAAVHTRQPLALARCLTQVAGWVVRPHARPVPAMASGQASQLKSRVQRLLQFESVPKRRFGMSVVLSSLLFTAVTLGVPGVSGSPGQSPVDVTTQDAHTNIFAADSGGAGLAMLPASMMTPMLANPTLLAAAEPEEADDARGAGVAGSEPAVQRAKRRAERKQARKVKRKRKSLQRTLDKAKKHRADGQRLDREVAEAQHELTATRRGLSVVEQERRRSRRTEAAAQRHIAGQPAAGDEPVVYRYSNGSETVEIRTDEAGELVIVSPDGRRHNLGVHAKGRRGHGPHVVDTRQLQAEALRLQAEARRGIDPEKLERLARKLERKARVHAEHAREIERRVHAQHAREIARHQRHAERQKREAQRREREAQRRHRDAERRHRDAERRHRDAERRHGQHQQQYGLSAEQRREIERDVQRVQQQMTRQNRELEREIEREARKLEAEVRKIERQVMRGEPFDASELTRQAQALERKVRGHFKHDPELADKVRRKVEKHVRKVEKKHRQKADKKRKKAAEKQAKKQAKKNPAK